MDIWRAFELLNRRKWLILFSLIVTTAIAFGATRLIGSKWVATARITSPQALSNVTSNTAQDQRVTTDGVTLKSMQSLYSAILLSSDVLGPAYKSVSEQLPTGIDLTRSIEFELLGPQLYEIHVTSPNAEKAELLVNALAERFVAYNGELNTKDAKRSVDLLQTQLKIESDKLEKARKRYREYADRNKIISTSVEQGRSALEEIEGTRAKLNEIRREMAAGNARQSELQGQLAELNTFLQNRPVLNGPRANALATELDRVSAELIAMESKGRLGSHPDVVAAKEQQNVLRKQVRETQQIEDAIAIFGQKISQRNEVQKNLTEVDARLAELGAQTGVLQGVISAAENRAQGARNLNDPYSSLGNEVRAQEEVRTALLTRLHNAQAALDFAKLQKPMILLERAGVTNPAINTTSGRTMKLIALSVLCTLIGSCILVLGLDNIDRRIKNLGEAEQLLPTRILAAIPQPEGIVSYSDMAQVTVKAPRSLSSEAYRFLGLHLLASAGPGARSLMVVSAKAEQGSTTTVCNLAITLAQAGHKVVLVDANMRTAEMHQVFKMQNEFGFSDLLMDPTITAFDKALRPTGVDNLSVITSGSDASNPWQLFRSNNLQAVSRKLRDMADYVLYDTPSGVMFTDALNLAPVVDGAILCVRALEVPTGVEKRLTDLITETGVNVLGAVLSDVPVEMVAGYENYQHYYAPQAQVPLIPGAVNYNGNGAHHSNGNGVHLNGTHSANGTTSSPTMVAAREEREEM